MEEEQVKHISWRAISKLLFPVLRPYWAATAAVFLFSLLLAALGVAEPYIYGTIIDALISAAGLSRITILLVWWAGISLVGAFLYALHAWVSWYLGNRWEGDLRAAAYRRILLLDIQRFQGERAGAMLSRFGNGGEAIWILGIQLLRSMLPAATTITMVVTVGFIMDWRLTLTALATVPLSIGIGIINLRVSQKHQEGMNNKWDEAVGLAGDSFANITTVQGEAGEPRVFKKFVATYTHVLKAQLKLNYLWAAAEAGTGGLYIVGRLLIFVVGIRLVLSGEATFGTLIMFLGFAGFIFSNVQQMWSALPEVARSLNRLDRLARLCQEVPAVRDRPHAKPVRRVKGEITFDRVWFSYGDGEVVLREVTFSAAAGETVAIVGESGAGKSTLAKLIIRFADPTKGAVRVDGRDIRDITLATLRPNIGFVMQENLLFHDTIINNIRFSKPSARRVEVIAAAKRAQAHEFIVRLPRGYDTVVGERGVKLSGGEKQRVALARVLLSDPPILVLDEATSALDSKTEYALQAALREVMKERTTIVIAHRLSTVMQANEILVMAHGRIVDKGRHGDLISRGGLYKEYWEIQAGGYIS